MLTSVLARHGLQSVGGQNGATFSSGRVTPGAVLPSLRRGPPRRPGERRGSPRLRRVWGGGEPGGPRSSRGRAPGGALDHCGGVGLAEALGRGGGVGWPSLTHGEVGRATALAFVTWGTTPPRPGVSTRPGGGQLPPLGGHWACGVGWGRWVVRRTSIPRRPPGLSRQILGRSDGSAAHGLAPKQRRWRRGSKICRWVGGCRVQTPHPRGARPEIFRCWALGSRRWVTWPCRWVCWAEGVGSVSGRWSQVASGPLAWAEAAARYRTPGWYVRQDTSPGVGSPEALVGRRGGRRAQRQAQRYRVHAVFT